MITRKLKEATVLLAGFAFISKDLEEHKKQFNLTNKDILETDDYPELRRVIRLLQRLEFGLKGKEKSAETYLNKCVARTNNKKKYSFTNALAGVQLLMIYKTDWKNKQMKVPIHMDVLNDIYHHIDKALIGVEAKKLLIDSDDLARDLYKEILK